MPIKNKLKVGVIGATGYTGLDLVYMLSKHPRVKITNLCATKKLGKKISHFDKRITNIQSGNYARLLHNLLDIPYVSYTN